MAKKVKSISFNDDNTEEKEMLKFVSRRNFSKYVKKLIKQDMADRISQKSSNNLQQEQEPSSETLTSVKKNLYQHYR
jgi:hypothetical protein